MDLSLLQNFQTLISKSLQGIMDDARIQYENMQEELQDKIERLDNENTQLLVKIKELNGKLEESNFCEDNFNRVSIISNLNKQIKELRNENSDLRNCLNKNFPMNPSLARVSSPSINGDLEEENQVLEDQEENVVEEAENMVEEENVVVEENVVEEENVVVEAENIVEEETVVEEEDVEEEEVTEIQHKEKTYFLVGGELFTKKKNGKRGKCVGKMVNGKPKLNKKKKKTES